MHAQLISPSIPWCLDIQGASCGVLKILVLLYTFVIPYNGIAYKCIVNSISATEYEDEKSI